MSAARPRIAHPDRRLYAVLAESGFAEDLFNPRQHESCELVEHYVLHRAIQLVDRLGIADALARGADVEQLSADGGFAPAFVRPLTWLLERLVAAGLVVREGRSYRLPRALPPVALDEIRAAGLALDPGYAAAYALVDECTAIYVKVAHGETSGERALFLRAALWAAYFDNRNGYYALTNRVAASALARRLPARDAHVLEVGGGLGSATQALIDALHQHASLGAVASYRFTEPVAFFRRRAERTLAAAPPALPLVFDALDLNLPWAAQGVEPGSLNAVWGVNVFHLARNLRAVLREALAALAPGGWIVIGEGVRPFPGTPVGAEFPFQLLDAFFDVELDAERTDAGFLTAEQWQQALAAAGFSSIDLVPDAVRLRSIHPAFYAAAICGRRPSGA